MHLRNTSMLAAIAGTALVLSLAACSDTTPKPTSTKSTTAQAAPESGTCKDGQLVITDKDLKGKAYTVDEPCDTVAVLTSGATITITTDIDTLSLEGSSDTIDAKHIAHVAAFGHENSVKHEGPAPEIADTGSGVPTDLELVQK